MIVFAHSIHVERGSERSVSAHAQVAMKSAELLHNAGADVAILTTASRAREPSLPWVFPDKVPLYILDDGIVRIYDDYGVRRRVNPVRLGQFAMRVRQLLKGEKVDVLHTFGAGRAALFAGAVGALDRKLAIVSTVYKPLESSLHCLALRRHDAVLTATHYVASKLKEAGVTAVELPHGPLKMKSPVAVASRTRVLFWREATYLAGADLCVDAFDLLAPEFPDTSFDFALRPAPAREARGIDELERRHSNVNVYRFPYENQITLEGLLAQSVCCVLPFRMLTCNPQFAILESMYAGVPVVTTNVGSNAEVLAGGGGLVTRLSAPEIADRVRRLLLDPELAARCSEAAAARSREKWSWRSYGSRLLSVYEKAVASRQTHLK